MKTLKEINEELKGYDNLTYLVSVIENDYENTEDPNNEESASFDNLEEAYNEFIKETLNDCLETGSEYKSIELLAVNHEFFKVLEDFVIKQEFTKEDYGKKIVWYVPKNNGVNIGKIETINEHTKWATCKDDRFSLKFEIFDNKKEAIEFIYNKSLYISMKEAKEIYKSNKI